jgi:hypothetical protein
MGILIALSAHKREYPTTGTNIQYFLAITHIGPSSKEHAVNSNLHWTKPMLQTEFFKLKWFQDLMV